jgi:uncharacterized protein
MRILLDTGPLVALLNHRETFHAWSIHQARQLSPPFLTCEAVLAEAHFLLSRVHEGNNRLIELLAAGRIEIPFSFATNRERVGELMRAYADVPMSFADACLVCMAEGEESVIFTLDSGFRVYRKHRRVPLRLIIP